MKIGAADFQGHEQIESGCAVMRTIVQVNRPILIEFAFYQRHSKFERSSIRDTLIYQCRHLLCARGPFHFYSLFFSCPAQLPLSQQNTDHCGDDGCDEWNPTESKSNWHYNDVLLMRR